MKYFLEKVAVSYPSFFLGGYRHIYLYLLCIWVGLKGPPTLVSAEALAQRRSVIKNCF